MDNGAHLLVLHYVFLPRINKVIETFVAGWNNHPIRTENNWSPNKIWTNSMLDRRNRNQMQVGEMFSSPLDDDLEWYGMDWSAPVPSDDGLTTVYVEDIIFEDDEMRNLMESVDPTRDSLHFGVDVYLDVLALCRSQNEAI